MWGCSSRGRTPARVTGSLSITATGLDSITSSNFMLCWSLWFACQLSESWLGIQKCPVPNCFRALHYGAVVGHERALDGKETIMTAVLQEPPVRQYNVQIISASKVPSHNQSTA